MALIGGLLSGLLWAQPAPTLSPPLPPEPQTPPLAEAAPDAAATVAEPDVQPAIALTLLDATVEPGTSRRLSWRTGFGYGLTEEPVPVLVVHGATPGPVLCLTAGIHGDELNGIEIVRRLMASADPKTLTGTLIGVPIVNVHGFQRRSRYLPDRRDLNRHFPGDPRGSLASRIGHDFFQRVVRHCEFLVDMHTGSFLRTNLPQLRADLRIPEVVELTRRFGAISVLHSPAASGTLRAAATKSRIPAVTFEVGEPNRLQAEDVALAVRGVQSLLAGLSMGLPQNTWETAQPVFYESVWVRVDRGGILFSKVDLGATVRRGDVLGTVTDPLSNSYTEVRAPFTGRVLGQALNQFVMPGFAAFRLGIETTEEGVSEDPLRPEENGSNGGEEESPS